MMFNQMPIVCWRAVLLALLLMMDNLSLVQGAVASSSLSLTFLICRWKSSKRRFVCGASMHPSVVGVNGLEGSCCPLPTTQHLLTHSKIYLDGSHVVTQARTKNSVKSGGIKIGTMVAVKRLRTQVTGNVTSMGGLR